MMDEMSSENDNVVTLKDLLALGFTGREGSRIQDASLRDPKT